MAVFPRRLLRHVPAVLGVILLVGAIYVVQKEFRHLRIADISKALSAIPRRALVLSFAWTLASYGLLTFYDRLGTIYAGNKVSYRKVAFASFCAYALAHNLGFSAVSGAAVRYRLYSHWGLTPLQIGKVITFCSLTFGLGGMVLAGIILLTDPANVPFFGSLLPVWSLYVIGLGMWVVVIGYVVLARVVGTVRAFGHTVDLPSWRMAILQVMLATVDVAITATIVHALLPEAPGLNWLRFVGVYLASYSAGLVATLPGGLGVFDSAMLIGLKPYLPPPVVLGGILVFRLYYYIIPLFFAGFLFAGNELLLRGRGMVKQGGRLDSGLPAVGRWSEPDFIVATVTGVVALCGVLLLSLGVLESGPDFSWIDPDFALVANQAGEFIPSLIGAALLVLAIALARRVNLAWGATLVLLLIATAFTLAQGEAFWIPAVLTVSAVIVAPFRSAFYRHARLLTGKLQASTTVPLVALAVCVLALASFERNVRFLDNDSWWAVILSPSVSNSMRASVALAVVLALSALWRLIRPSRVSWLAWTAEARLRYAALGAVPPAVADGLVFGESERAAVPFRRVGRVLLALGDPAGAESDRAAAIWRLRDLADQEGLHPAIWRAGPALLKIYADLGLSAIPLDAHGLPTAPDAGSREFLVCQAERDFAALRPLLPGFLDAAPDAAANPPRPALSDALIGPPGLGRNPAR